MAEKKPAEGDFQGNRQDMRSNPDKPTEGPHKAKSETKSTVSGDKDQPLQGDQGDDHPERPPIKATNSGQEMQAPRMGYTGGEDVPDLRPGDHVFMFDAGPGMTAYVRGVDWPEDRGNVLVARHALTKVEEQG